MTVPFQTLRQDSVNEVDWRNSLPTDSTPIARKGLLCVGVVLAIFFVWGMAFPLSSSVVALGKVTPTGRPKLVQHPAGGVVTDIIARDGDRLTKGDLIAIIEPALANAELANLLARRSLLEAQESRLISMKSGSNEFQRPAAIQVSEMRGTRFGGLSLASNLSNSFSDVLREQEAEFNASRNRLAKELSALENQLGGLVREKTSLEARAIQHDRRIAITQEQVTRMRPLADAGYIAKARLWDTEAQLADFEGTRSQLNGEIASREANIAELEDRISVLRSSSMQEISKERSTILTELASINEQIKAAELAVEYSEMRAPVSGTLTKLQISTIGGVIEPGLAIAEIIPDDARMEVEARVLPQDMGQIETGQTAEMIVTSFNRRISDPVIGRVNYVAANSTLDERTGESYFVVRIEPEAPDTIANLSERLISGMEAQVYIKTGSRSFFSWLLAPVLDSVRRAFNEA